MKNQKRIQAFRQRGHRVSTLTLNGPAVRLTLRVEARMNSSQRRAIAITFFRQIRPWLDYFYTEQIHHLEDRGYYFDREELEGLRDFGRRPVSDPQGALGFQIRMRRLELGWSQRKLARKARLSFNHLSRLERGLCKPRPQTLARLRVVLFPRPGDSQMSTNVESTDKRGDTHAPANLEARPGP